MKLRHAAEFEFFHPIDCKAKTVNSKLRGTAVILQAEMLLSVEDENEFHYSIRGRLDTTATFFVGSHERSISSDDPAVIAKWSRNPVDGVYLGTWNEDRSAYLFSIRLTGDDAFDEDA